MVKNVIGERLDYNPPKKNCAGCEFKVGLICEHYGAYLQSNQHRPTDCTHWEVKKDD